METMKSRRSVRWLASITLAGSLALSCSTASKTAECVPPCVEPELESAAAPAQTPATAVAASPAERVVVTAVAAEDLQSAFKAAILEAGPAVVSCRT